MAGDLILRSVVYVHPRFNPRPRMAGDATYQPLVVATSRFNPRPRMAGDVYFVRVYKALEVSIHARVWRATD